MNKGKLTRRKKVYVNAYFKNNVGDDLFLYVLTKRYSRVDFYADVPRQYQDTLLPLSNLRMKQSTNKTLLTRKIIASLPWIPFINGITRYDAIVEIGGSIFMQAPGNPRASGLRRAFTRKKIPYFVIGSNFGPFCDTDFVEEYNKLFSQTAGVVFRDNYSADLFDGNNKISVAPDVVFGVDPASLGYHSDEPSGLLIVTPVDLSRKGECLSDQMLSSAYESRLAAIIDRHVATGREAVIMSFCSDENDEIVARRIYENLDCTVRDRVSVTSYKDVNQLFTLFSKAGYLISSRYHSMILGWLFDIPQLVIPYSQKTEHVRKELFPMQFSQSVQSFAVNNDRIDLQDFNTMSPEQVSSLRLKSAGQFKYTDLVLKN